MVQVLLDRSADMSLGNGQAETARKAPRKNGHRAVVVQVLADRNAPEDVRRSTSGRVTDALSQNFHRS